MSKEKSINTLLLDGGCHCFNFSNTIHSRVEEIGFEYLNNYKDLIEWSHKVNLLPADRLDILEKKAKKTGEKTEQVFLQIKSKRDVIYHIFSSIIDGKAPEEPVVKKFNNALQDALSNLVFKFNKGKTELVWKEDEVNLLEPQWVIFKDAYDVLTLINSDRYKECENCGWLFLDNSKNKSRVWCNMKTCGSITKAKRYYYNVKKKI